MHWLLLLLTIVFTAIANLLLKHSAQQQTRSALDARALDRLLAVLEPHTLGGLTLLGIAFLAYTQSLRRLDLSVAYPIMTGSAIALVALGSVRLFDEDFGAWKIAGTALILIGVFALTR